MTKKRRTRLKELRESCGLKQSDLAEQMGVVPRQYFRYEHGEQEPNLAGWILLADFYDVSLDYLVGRSDDPKRYGAPGKSEAEREV